MHNQELATTLDSERSAQLQLSQHVSTMETRLRESLGVGSARESALHEQVSKPSESIVSALKHEIGMKPPVSNSALKILRMLLLATGMLFAYAIICQVCAVPCGLRCLLPASWWAICRLGYISVLLPNLDRTALLAHALHLQVCALRSELLASSSMVDQLQAEIRINRAQVCAC